MKINRMFYHVFAISFGIICLLFPFSFSNANPSFNDDKMLIGFMKGHKNIRTNKIRTLNEAYLGIVHFLKKNWQCDKIKKKYEECQKYCNYLDILYEYLFREFVGLPVVKPKFMLKKRRKEDKGSIINVVNCLAKFSCFYFDSNLRNKNNLITIKAKPELLNKKRLNYEAQKIEQLVPINESVLQLAIDAAYEWPPNESVDGLIRQIFNENLDGMLKKAAKCVQNGSSSSSSPPPSSDDASSGFRLITRLLDFFDDEEKKMKIVKQINKIRSEYSFKFVYFRN